MIKHATLVQCTNAKRDTKSQAGKLYDESAYFRKQRRYAKQNPGAWFIQSAKHGLLQPGQVIEPYNMTPRDISDTEKWAKSITDSLAGVVKPHGATVEILGGKAYADPLTPELERVGYEVHEPLRGLKIGTRMQRLDEWCRE